MKILSVITALAGFYLFPNLLATDLLERNTVGFAVYAVYIISIMSWAYYIRRQTQDDIKTAYWKAKKAGEKARFEERMRQL